MERQQALERIRQHLRTAYLLDEERSAAMIPVFLANLGGHMQRLTELAVEGDGPSLARAAHAVKGALLNLGLAELAEIAQVIERHGKEQVDRQAAHRAITVLQAEIDELIAG